VTNSTISDYPSTQELVGALAARRVSSVELAEHAIARIEALDERFNAVVVRDFERGLRAASEADAALARGEKRPLLGLPFTVKESYNVAGLPTTWGMPPFADWIASEDAVTVSRLKAAGAVLLGKTNVPYALGDWQSYNDIYGTTNNPYDVTRTPGGSSGGSSAALAAGYVSLEMGSDIAGSLRAPAHYCGIFSHKPSRTVIPVRGQMVPGTSGLTPDLAVLGPMARSARDLVLAFDVVAGPDEPEATAYKLVLPPPRHAELRDYRVLIVDSHPILPADRSVRGAIAELASRLRGKGATVAESSPLLPDLTEAARTFIALLLPVIFSRQPIEHMQRIVAAAAALPPDVDSLGAYRLRAAASSHRDWLAADGARIRLAAQWRRLFAEWDIVIFPVMPTPAFVQDQTPDQNDRKIDIDGTPYPYLDQLVYASLASAPGLPVTTAPVGRSASGLPIGVQIMGPFLEDLTTLHFAELIEREWGGFIPPAI